jgi:hypothetical protein
MKRRQVVRVKPSIPRGARERVIERHASGVKARSQFYVDRKLVGEMLWDQDGERATGWGIRDGKKHGRCVEWINGKVIYLETYANGLLNGIARHWDEDGMLLLETRYVRGTGVDLWCDYHHCRTLAEETRLRDGDRHGFSRNWHSDGRTVFTEEHYFKGLEHGIFRRWNDRKRLCRTFPRYFIHGERVNRRTYLRRAQVDETLPRWRTHDNNPRRPLPPEYVGQPIDRERSERGPRMCRPRRR